MVDISDSTKWSQTDASNNSASPNGWTSSTMLPSQVEPTARMMMGGIKRFYDHVNATITSGGAANVQTLTYSVAPTAYVSGDRYTFIAGFTNAAATTLNVNALGPKNVKIGSAALAGGEIISGQVVDAAYDGTQFQLLNPAQATGSWTPVITFGGGNTGITYSAQTGTYYRVGKLVFIAFDLTLSAKGSSTGNATIGTLPFASASFAQPCQIGFYSGMLGITDLSPTFINASNSFISPQLPNANTTTAVTDANFTNTSRMSGSCTYISA